MGYSTRSYARGYAGRSSIPTGVRWLLIINIVLFVTFFFGARTGLMEVFQHLGLVPAQVVKTFAIWQLFTYMFLHSPFGYAHILFNMLMLWMFGKDLEVVWGTRRFLQYYFICGVGAGICVVLANFMFGNPNTRTIGASGAIYGLLLAFGVVFADTQVLFAFLFPMKAKYMVMIMAAIAFISSFDANSEVSNVAHLGGMAVGYVYIKTQMERRRTFGGGISLDIGASLKRAYKSWKLERDKRKFQVYLRKHGGGPGSRLQ